MYQDLPPQPFGQNPSGRPGGGMAFSSALPYPPVRAEGKNVCYAREMLDNLGGNNSEMTAVCLYFYNNMITSNYPDIPYIFHKISIVEMRHMEIFGTLARQLGEDPRLWTQKGMKRVYWTPAYDRYPVRLKDILLNALNGENDAIYKYESQLSRIEDENIAENLKRIIADEKLHVEIFTRLYHDYCR